MSSEELYSACKNGDLEKVKNLIEKKGIDPSLDNNEAYRWASLCRHYHITNYLRKFRSSLREN